ncbi:Zinc finger domain containing protein [Aphelenchoides besseyi]|nr:Zinc finger domain containing protein [Aphelenchoides besseyi]
MDQPANQLADLNLEDEEEDEWPIAVDGDDDQVSFEDSERFEEDESVCSWQSENESLDRKWSEWTELPTSSKDQLHGIKIPKLAELSAQIAASSLSFDSIEIMYHQLMPANRIPDDILKPILRRCFPSCSEDIRTYSFITSGKRDAFEGGKKLFEQNVVHEVMQIGYHISAKVSLPETFAKIKGQPFPKTPRTTYKVSIRVDRCRIVSCNCSCDAKRSWCEHIVAVSLFRIHRTDLVAFRSTIWDSITELNDEKLKKFAQYMINSLPTEYLPVAQQLIDDLLNPTSEINKQSGAPDPTAGSGDLATWCMDEKMLQDSIRRILIQFVKSSFTIHCDIAYLHATSTERQNSAAEFLWLQRIQQSHDPDSLWKLLDIVVHMLKRNDENATTLLHTITEHCLCVDQVIMWWYQSRLLATGQWHFGINGQERSSHSQTEMKRVAASSLCEEIVRLWRLAAMNPRLTQYEREQLGVLLRLYHRTAVSRIWRMLENTTVEQNLYDTNSVKLTTTTATFGFKSFPGFFSALQSCHFDWTNGVLIATCSKVGAESFRTFVETRNSLARDGSVTNLPILRQGAASLAEELADTEHQITTTLNVEELIAQRYRSKRQARQKRKRKNLARHDAQLQVLNRQLANPPPPPSDSRHRLSADYAANLDGDLAEEEAGPSNQELNAKQMRRSLRVTIDREMNEIQELFAKAAQSYSDEFQRLFACCESMVCYGWPNEARLLAEQLALGLLNSRETTNDTKRVITNLKRTIFLLKTLVRHSDGYGAVIPQICPVTQRQVLLSNHVEKKFYFTSGSNALRLALCTLSTQRSAAPTKQLEVQIFVLEHELYNFLRNGIAMSADDLRICREMAVEFLANNPTDQPSQPRGLIPPILFAHFIWDVLHQSNDQLALAVAVTALKQRVSFPIKPNAMVFECLRRQRNEFAFQLLTKNCDARDRLNLILDSFLDPEIHCIYSGAETNAILSRSCSQCQPQMPFCVCWRKVARDSGTRRAHFQQPSSSIERSDSPKRKTWNQRNTFEISSYAQQHASDDLTNSLLEMAKKLIQDSSGGHQNFLNVDALVNGGQVVANRELQMCALIIGLYALGVNNIVDQSGWTARHYSMLVGWLLGQIMDLGPDAMKIVSETWEMHFSAGEVVGLVEKAFQAMDERLNGLATQLLLSAFHKADRMTKQDCQKALNLCRDSASTHLQRACEIIEEVAKHDGISPEILFNVSEHYLDLYNADHRQPQPQWNYPQDWYQQQAYAYNAAYPPIQQPSASGFYYQQPNYFADEPQRLHASHSAPNLQPAFLPPQVYGNWNNGYQQPQYNYWNRPSYQRYNKTQLNRCAYNLPHWRLLKAHEIGMKAMDKMGPPNFEETRDYVKFSNNPDFKSDILNLMNVSLLLGPGFAQQFCEKLSTCLASPHLLIQIFEVMINKFLMRQNFIPKQPVYIQRPYSKDRNGKESSYIDYRRVSCDIREILVNDLGYMPPLAELGRACAETLYRAMSRKMNHPNFVESDKIEAKELIILAIRFFGFFDYSGVQLIGQQLLEIFVNAMKNQKNRRLFIELYKEVQSGISG